MQIEELRYNNTDDALEERLGKPTQSLTGLYQEVYDRINHHPAQLDRHLVQRAFSEPDNYVKVSHRALSRGPRDPFSGFTIS